MSATTDRVAAGFQPRVEKTSQTETPRPRGPGRVLDAAALAASVARSQLASAAVAARGLLLLAVEHPLHPEGVLQHAEAGTPESVLERHRDLTALRERVELLLHVGDVVEGKVDVRVVSRTGRLIGRRVGHHQLALAQMEKR